MKLSKEQIQAIVLAVIVVFGGGWVYWAKFYSPLAKEIETLKKDLASKKDELDKLRYIPNELERERRELEEKRLELAGVEGMLPKEKEIPSLLRSITQKALAHGIDILSFTPQDLKPGEVYNEVPIDIKVKANYHELGMFLNEVGHLHRIIVPSIKSLEGKEPTKEDPYTLTGSLTLSAFVYKE